MVVVVFAHAVYARPALARIGMCRERARGCNDGTGRVSTAFPIFSSSAGSQLSCSWQAGISPHADCLPHYTKTTEQRCHLDPPLPAATTDELPTLQHRRLHSAASHLSKAATCSPSSVSATFGPISQATPLHPAGQPAVTSRRQRATSVGIPWRASRQGTRIVPSVWLCRPVVQDLACRAALVPLCVQLVITWQHHSEARRFHSPAIHGRAETSHRCGLLRDVHETLRWLGRRGVIELMPMSCSVYSWSWRPAPLYIAGV